MLKKSTAWSVLVYGILLIILGIYGYYQADSKISLYAGSGFGVLLTLASFGIFANQKWSAASALILTLLLTALFAIRYSTTGKAMPAILSVISGGMLLFLLAQAGAWKKSE